MRVTGRYINMDASAERRVRMEAQLAAAGCAEIYRRFRAVDGRGVRHPGSKISQGELGCFLSHYACILEAPADQNVHVIEDDVELAPQTMPLIGDLQESLTEQFDLLFTDIFVPLNMGSIFNLMEFYRASGMAAVRQAAPSLRMPTSILYPSLRPIEFTGATSYIVSRRARHKLRRLLEEELDAGPRQPIDMAFRRWIADGRLEGLCTMPFLTSIQADSIRNSTISDRAQDPATAFAYYLLRRFFYVAKDDAALVEAARSLSGDLADPGYMDSMLEVFRFLFSEKFVAF
ncbi:MAG TPA: glycosyltransferase family 25 protein [Caulobacteraceae bacterium]|nr:glycosyltransferase family 25 protein [Caulobacteraceae bacterium]